ncbi:MAG: efflux RND transporter periplasmic adaptor subunit [Acidobacteriia bacterium]|nr:efflux RND transporter periplasmic adaptor subunit [Terriglobia bacterium]
MDVIRKDARKKKLIRRILVVFVLLVAVSAGTVALSKLKPAAPGVEMSTLWPGTVKRGNILLDVRGLGTLVPEDTMLIPATTDGRVQRILVYPGTPVTADTVVMVLTSQELETATLDAEYALKAADAEYDNLKVTLEKAKIDLQAMAAQVGADYDTAKLESDRDADLAKQGLSSALDAKISAVKAQELGQRYALEQKRLEINASAEEAQLAAQKVKVEQLRAQYNLKKSQLDQLKVKAGFDGVLQQLPTPVEVGQKVTAGTPLGKVAQRSKLKAELKIAETQVKDVTIGQPAQVDTRNGIIEGSVSRIDPSVLNGTVTVDVRLKGPLPDAARPDLSVDGTVQLQKLNNVVYVERPVFGQQDASVQLFKVEPDGKFANKVKVTFGRASVNFIEVKDGLQVGDKVILSDMSAYDSYDRIRLN